MDQELEIERRFQQGDREAWGELFDRHHAPLLNHIRNLPGMSSQRDADYLAWDIASDSFIKAWDAHASFNLKWRWSTWVYRFAENRFTDILRSRGRHRPSEFNLDLTPEGDDGDDGDDSMSLLSGLDIGFSFGPGEEKFVPTTIAEKLDAFYARVDTLKIRRGHVVPSKFDRFWQYTEHPELVPLSKRERIVVNKAMKFAPRKSIAKELDMGTKAFDVATSRIRKKIMGNC